MYLDEGRFTGEKEQIRNSFSALKHRDDKGVDGRFVHSGVLQAARIVPMIQLDLADHGAATMRRMKPIRAPRESFNLSLS
jgi:hypothetical protein